MYVEEVAIFLCSLQGRSNQSLPGCFGSHNSQHKGADQTVFTDRITRQHEYCWNEVRILMPGFKRLVANLHLIAALACG